MALTSDEVNLLVYRYLQESGACCCGWMCRLYALVLRRCVWHSCVWLPRTLCTRPQHGRLTWFLCVCRLRTRGVYIRTRVPRGQVERRASSGASGCPHLVPSEGAAVCRNRIASHGGRSTTWMLHGAAAAWLCLLLWFFCGGARLCELLMCVFALQTGKAIKCDEPFSLVAPHICRTVADQDVDMSM